MAFIVQFALLIINALLAIMRAIIILSSSSPATENDIFFFSGSVLAVGFVAAVLIVMVINRNR